MQNTTQHLIERYYAAFNRQDTKSFLDLLHEDVIHDINQGGKEIGKKLFDAFLTRMNRCYKETVENLIIMVNPDGTRAAAEFVIDGLYITTDNDLPEATGQHYSLPCGAFFSIQDNKIMRITNYYNLNDWILQIKG